MLLSKAANADTILRQKAETLLKQRIDIIEILNKEDSNRLVHELGILQIEFELQNEELRKATEKCEDLKNKYLEFYHFAPIGFISFDPAGLIQDINITGAKILGKDKRFLINKPILPYIDPDYKDTFQHHCDAVFKDTSQKHCELKMIRKDKTCFYVRFQSISSAADAGQNKICVTALTDISEHKQAEDALRESEERMRVALEGADLGTWDLDLTTGASVHSFRHDQIFGYQEPQPEWNYDVTVRHMLPEDRPIAREALINAEKKGEISFEVRVYWPDGSVHWIAPRGRVYFDNQGRAVRIIGVVADITERKRAENAMLESEAKLRGILDATQESVFMFSPEGNILLANPAALERLGKSSDEVIGKPFSDFVSKELALLRLKHLREVVQTEQPIKAEDHLEGIYFHHRFYPIFDPSGRVLSIVSYSKDITERKTAENALRESNERYRSLFEGIPISTVVFQAVTDDFVIVDYNHAAMIFTDGKMPNFLGKKASELYNEKILKIFNLVKTNKSKVSFETPFHKLGTCSDIHLRMTLAYVEPKLVLMHSEDLTERKKAEETLRESEAQFHSVLDNSVNLIYRFNLQTGRFVYVSPSCETILGFTPDEMMQWDAETASALIHPEDMPAMTVALSLLADSGAAIAEYRQRTKSGKYRWLSNHMSLTTDDSGLPLFRNGNIRDITELKQNEKALQTSNSELHKINRALSAKSRCDKAILKYENETEFLDEVCKIVVKICGYAMAWVGYSENDAHKTVRPVAVAGHECGYLDTVNITWADTKRGHGPTGTAIRTGKPCFCRDMQTDPNFKPWRENALKRGFNSSLAFPLIFESRTFGAITIYSYETDPFSDYEVLLLSDLADDLAYGIAILRLRASHAQAEKDLSELNNTLESRINEAVENIRIKDVLIHDQSRLAMMGEMIGNIAHQWRQPLNILSLITNNLMLNYGKNLLNHEYMEKTERDIYKQLEYMSNTIEEFRNFMKPDQKKKTFSLSRAVNSAVSLIEAAIKDEYITLDIEIIHDLTISGYQNEFIQAILNILNNAKDILIERKIENPRIAIQICTENDKGLVIISDNAGGIQEDALDKVFAPYFTTKKEGTGIGLYLTKTIIENKMGGTLTVQNNQEGAEFHIRL